MITPTTRTFALVAVSLFTLALGAAAKTNFDAIVLPPHPTAHQVSKYLDKLEEDIRDNLEQHEGSGFITIISAQKPADDVLMLLRTKLAAVPLDYLDQLGKAAGSSDSPIFVTVMADSLAGRRDYQPQHRRAVLKNLNHVPKLILVLERMGWVDVTDRDFLSAWYAARNGKAADGTLDLTAYRFAGIAASHGLTEGLVALARNITVRRSVPASPQRDAALRNEITVLHLLVPGLDAAAAPDLVLKNPNSLVFDPQKRTYSMHL